MKKLALVFIAIFLAATLCAMEDNLYERFKKHAEINVFLEDVAVEASDPHVKEDMFRSVFKETIENRREMRFLCVNNKSEADIIIKATIHEYNFVEKAMPMFLSAASLAADTLSPKSSAKLVVNYEVISPPDSKLLLQYKRFATEERMPKDDMAGEQGFIHAVRKNVNRFVHKAFHKPKPRM